VPVPGLPQCRRREIAPAAVMSYPPGDDRLADAMCPLI
jgi:hypothetical protein